MSIELGTFEFIIIGAFVLLCAWWNYRAGRQAGIDQMIDHMEDIGTLKIVEENGKNVYLFATHGIEEK